MRKLIAMMFAVAVLGASVSLAQPPAAKSVTVKAVQPGLFEVAAPRVNEVVAEGITKITATPGKGRRSIAVESQWGDSYFGWPKGVTAVPFTITTTGEAGTATISAPGFTKANQEDYKTAIEKIVPHAISSTRAAREWSLGSGR